MFHFGFSYVGLIFLIMLFVPNIIWTKNVPVNYEKYSKNENKVLLVFERAGEVLVTCLLLIFSDFNIRNSYWAVFLALAFLCMVMYEICWGMYFKSSKTMYDYYKSVLGIPVPLASLPVAAAFMLGIYGSNIFLILASIFLGIGHIGIHLGHRDEAFKEEGITLKKRNVFIKILRVVFCTLVCFLLALTCIVIAFRNITYISHVSKATEGVVDAHYIELGGQEQYILERGNDVSNPVIIYLHGGPSSPDSFETYVFTDYLADNYTVISWDQRGCGRTYFNNNDAGLPDDTVDFERAVQDVDELVDYALERYNQDKVIIMGWSYGTILGSRYVIDHPEKVSAYVGIGQFINMQENELIGYEVALERATEAGDDTSLMQEAFANYQSTGAITDMLKVRNITYSYLAMNQTHSANQFLEAVLSPYFGMDDFRWFLLQLGDTSVYMNYNAPLFDYLTVDVSSFCTDFEIPVYYITGSEDYTCNPDLVEGYLTCVNAPEAELIIMDGCGHGCHYDNPEEFNRIITQILN